MVRLEREDLENDEQTGELAAAAGSDDTDATFARAANEENWFLTRADIDT